MKTNKKKLLLVAMSLTSLSAVAVSVVALSQSDTFSQITKADLSYSLTLNGDSSVESEDMGYLHSTTVKNNTFDIIGYTASNGKFAKISKKTYNNVETYNGMIYNRSAINGFKTLKVVYSGAQLYYTLTDFLMEDMNFDKANALESNVAVNVEHGEAYFVVYTDSTEGAEVSSLTITYDCDHSIDQQMIYDASDVPGMGGARSWTNKVEAHDSFVRIENNPTETTNNYSLGKTGDYNNTWYRFNGRYFKESQNLGTNFSFGMTIMGNISQAVNAHSNQFDNFFHYNVWPQFSYGRQRWDEKKQKYVGDDEQWMQAYMGNDNYEPLGAEHSIHQPSAQYDDSYEGRFFTDYGFVSYGNYVIWNSQTNSNVKEGGVDKTFATMKAAKDYADAQPNKDYLEPYENGTYEFLDPDTTKVLNGDLTYRQAYEAFNMPYWYVRFDVYLSAEKEPMCDISINGFKISTCEIFERYDKENMPDIKIVTMPLHVVNYGKDANGTPANPYAGYFTYPRLIEDSETYYLKGSFNEWSEGKNYQLTMDSNDPNHYFIKDVELEAGDLLKVYYPAGAEGKQWKTNESEFQRYWSLTNDSEKNIKINTTARYDIDFYVDSTNPIVLNPKNLKTIYFTDNGYWNDIHAYIWDNNAGGYGELAGWPGVSMTWVETNDYGQNVYLVDFNYELYDYVIFNGNGKQTINISFADFINNNACYLDGTQTGDNYNVTFYTR